MQHRTSAEGSAPDLALDREPSYEDLNEQIRLFMKSTADDCVALSEELNNLTKPALMDLLQLLINVRTKAEEWGQKNPLPRLSGQGELRHLTTLRLTLSR